MYIIFVVKIWCIIQECNYHTYNYFSKINLSVFARNKVIYSEKRYKLWTRFPLVSAWWVKSSVFMVAWVGDSATRPLVLLSKYEHFDNHVKIVTYELSAKTDKGNTRWVIYEMNKKLFNTANILESPSTKGHSRGWSFQVFQANEHLTPW